MEKEAKRYRVSPKRYLCLSPGEAVSTGISVGEEMVEEIILIKSQGFGYRSYASLRELPQEQLMSIPPENRHEMLFDSRKDALRFISENDLDGSLHLYAIKEKHMVSREKIEDEQELPIDDFLDSIKDFGK